MKKLYKLLRLQFAYIIAVTFTLSTVCFGAVIVLDGKFYVIPTATKDSCDSSHLDLCTVSNNCTSVGGYWWSDNTCNSTVEPVPGMDLQGAWTDGSCSYDFNNGYITDGSDSAILTIEGDTATYQETTYWNSGCVGNIYEINTWVYRLTIGDNFVSSDGENVNQIKLETIEYYWQPFNYAEINDYSSNYERFCGFIPSPGQIISEKDCNFPSQQDEEVGITTYGLYQVDNGVLYMNGSRGNDTYPDSLNKNYFSTTKYTSITSN